MDPASAPSNPMYTNEILIDILKDTADVDYTDNASVLFGLFDGTVQPDIFLTFANKVAFQQVYIVKVLLVITRPYHSCVHFCCNSN